MVEIFSKIEKDKLLHQIYRRADFLERENLVDESEFLQVSAIRTEDEVTYRPHIHLFKEVGFTHFIAQEAWVIVDGQVLVDYYDLDGSLIESHKLEQGDCSITLYGGHGYHTSENAKVYEFKTGPYLGIEKDKRFIEEI